MRNTLWWLTSSLALAALGCSGGGSVTSPANPAGAEFPAATPAGAGLGAIYQNADISQSALGLYTIDIDPTTLSATATLSATRTGQANDDVYALAIDNFLRGDSFRIGGVSSNGTTLDLSYAVSHPFPAPSDPTGTPNGSTNRADLCVSGFVCFLTDVPSAAGNTYFTDRVANTAAITNADAYFSPEGMITYSGTANTFPYKLIVDETQDPRLGVSNGGDVTGNYGADGWTRSEFGAGNNGWTGYGILAQGQTAQNSVSLDLNELAANGFSFDVAVIAKYNDPRGGENAAAKRGNRLPPASPDSSLFAYRMPHGALDVASIEFDSETGGFIQDQVSSSTLYFRVVDWDARATETAEADLADDSTVTNVEVGESGLPDFAVCIPGVLGDETVIDDWDPATDVQDDDSGFGGDVDEDSGAQGDPLFYCKSVTKTVTSGQSFGDFTGMARATDVNAAAPFWVPLNEGSPPLPLSADLPIPETFQAFTVNMLVGNIQPTGDWTLDVNPIFDGGSTTITVSNVVDPDSTDFDIEVDWDNDGTFDVVATAQPVGAGPFGPFASPTYTLANPMTQEMITITVRLRDGVSSSTLVANNVGGDVLTVDPIPPCSDPLTEGTTLFNADFETTTGDNAWQGGGYGLTNTDPQGWSSFARCTTAITGLSGFKWHTGPDGGSCGSFNGDYWPGVDNNITMTSAVSLAGKTAARLRFDSYKDVATAGAVFEVYASTNGGGSWGTPIYSAGSPANNIGETDIVVNIDSLVGQNVILRFRFNDPAQFGSGSPFAGWGVDNVEILTCP